jgi:LemA family
MTSMLILLGVVAILALTVIAIYNRLVALRQNCRQGAADIDAQLIQRNDLIPNLVETVKGYASHETSTLDAVITARAKAAGGSAEGEQELAGALRGLFGARSMRRWPIITARARRFRRCCSPARWALHPPISQPLRTPTGRAYRQRRG